MSDPILVQPDTEDNRNLAANLHPSGWVNPVPSGRYNLVVVGGGTAGLVCAAGAAGLGAKVALVERHLLGGDCLNVGCVPSKALIHSSRMFWESQGRAFPERRAGEIAFGKALERMRRLRAELSPHDSARRFRDELGVDVFFGQGSFTAPGEIEVDGRRLLFARAVLCTGGRPAAPGIPGLSEAGYLTNETVFALTSLPPRLAVIGAGPIGCELAQVFARFGSRVTILERGGRLLPREDADAGELLLRSFVREGIDVRFHSAIASVSAGEGGKALVLEREGERVELEVDAILVAAGRIPNLEGLGLESAGIASGRSGVVVDDFLRTTNRRVYAAGDVCPGLKFTHLADAQARIVIANALFHGRQRNSRLTVPWCTYTDPEIAHVGNYPEEAAARGVEASTLTVPLAEVDRALLDGETDGFARVYLKKGSDRILGATLVARHAGEMLNELSLAIGSGAGLSAIGRTVHPYPTQAEAIRKLADLYNRSRLTPRLKNLLTAWLRWQRH
ncbi:mercuric reductase [Geomonas sp. Red32]|uniref:mercuric reductase n=1 Tax=Geomonas sp. Red32 TaxID=2912856 RepID=UPI00202D08ED|nr:mercuric reductase [Geomonas sp. Red32]MCM0080241.1 mercuric reductase [Geomonas sp. Red32]